VAGTGPPGGGWQDGRVTVVPPAEPAFSLPEVPGRPLRVAAAQAVAVPGEIAENAATATRLVARAAEEGVRLVVLPELFLPGYHPPTLAAEPSRCDLVADEAGVVRDSRLAGLATAAAGQGVAVLVGAAVRAAEGQRYLALLLVGPDGTVRDAYHKRHLCGPEEQDLFVPGTGAAAIELDGWRLGLGVCYDGCFPEHARAAARAGAHAYLCPSAYLVGSEHRRDLYYPARALDNTFFVVFADAVGGPDPWRFSGGSAVFDPEGRPLVRATDHTEELLVADLDPALLRATRDGHPMLADQAAFPEPAEVRLLAVTA
jgi:predicted amidohydrolase